MTIIQESNETPNQFCTFFKFTLNTISLETNEGGRPKRSSLVEESTYEAFDYQAFLIIIDKLSMIC